MRADNTKLGPDLNKTKSKTASAFASIAKNAKVAMAAVAVAATVAGAKLIAVGRQSIELAERQINAEQRLAAVIRATGGAAGFTASELETFATQLQKATGVGDEAILESQAILLTFRTITGDVFKETTKLALDMSAVLGGDSKSAFLQLGKALEDPIVGLGALKRSGVSFTEQQKEQIKTLVESNKLQEAQAMILKTVRGQVGGVAAALLKTDAGKIKLMRSELGDLREEMGRRLLPLQIEFLKLQKELAPIIGDLVQEFLPMIKDILPDFVRLIKSAIPVWAKFFKLTTGRVALFGLQVLADLFSLVADSIESVVDGLTALGAIDVDKKLQTLKAAGDKPLPGLREVPGDERKPPTVTREDIDAFRAIRDRTNIQGPTTQKSPLQQGLGGDVGPGIPGLIPGIGAIVTSVLASPQVRAAVQQGNLVAPGRSGFVEFGNRIQDALLNKERENLDKERNKGIFQQVTLMEQILRHFNEDAGVGGLIE